jgi:hypothetical protein
MPVLLGAAHVANTTDYELLAWAALALVVARIGRTGDCRWWLAGAWSRGAVALDAWLEARPYVCTGLRHPWAQLWPRLRHYD